jgi:hypothetical protein
MFVVVKFFFGLGAMLTLLGIGIVLLWFVLHHIVRLGLRNQPSNRHQTLRQIFLETPPNRPARRVEAS